MGGTAARDFSAGLVDSGREGELRSRSVNNHELGGCWFIFLAGRRKAKERAEEKRQTEPVGFLVKTI